MPAPALTKPPVGKSNDWSALPLPLQPQVDPDPQDGAGDDHDPTGSERRKQPELATGNTVEKKAPIHNEFDLDGADDADDDATRSGRMNQVMQGIARQVSLDPNDGMDL